jgi:hypothetical protein
VKPTPKGANKPSPHSIMHALDKPGGFTTVSKALADTGPCLQARAFLFASRYT